MPTPKISVVVPAFNHEAYIAEALTSVLGQTLADLELIVIDDASRDGTWDIIQGIRDPRLRALRHSTNQGAHATLNEGLALARGDYLAILNSDDAFHPERLARMVAALGTDLGLAFSGVDFIDSHGQPAPDHERARDYAAASTLCAAQPPASWLLTSNLAITTSNFVFPRALLRQVGEFSDLRYTHDWEWALRASSHTPPLWLPEPLVRYRVHPSNTLAEDDVWRHIHENAYIQTLALGGTLDGLDAEGTCTALLHNPSLPPLATLCFGIAARRLPDPAALRALTRPGPDGWFLPRLARATGLDERIFRSARQLSDQQAALDAQVRLIDERWATIEEMSTTIAERDTALNAQAELIEARAAAMAHMSTEIAHRDDAIAAQGRLLEERFTAMEEMGREIHARNEQIGLLNAQRDAAQQQFDATRSELQALYQTWWIRIGLAIRRRLPGSR
ncbi:glycosyltransferase [Zoogloea sp.]|uniref:glycosyltransferase family 2 protein n=1 Tax=Zoogloea sp. TaxID=49181 RepID=UPI0025CCDF1A|nr:glycosyltransferase [Zoogloea sp.]MCK6393457.1 glycosyltransferase [Zoogloea sp.]